MTQSSEIDQNKRFTITQLCREFDVTARTLRFYEDKGLLHPARDGVNRVFSFRDKSRLKLILRGKRIGFSLNEIKEMLDLYNLKNGQVQQLLSAKKQGTELLAKLDQKRADLAEAISDLRRAMEIVDGLLDGDDGAGGTAHVDAAQIRW